MEGAQWKKEGWSTYALHTDTRVLAHKRELNYAVGKYRLSLKLPRSLPIDLRCNMSITLAM